MLVDHYIAALLADERAADEIFELWDAGLISDSLAAWWVLAHLTQEA
jgi:hypothetical protein